MDANKPLSTWYETGKPCPECGTKMNSDGRVYYCPGCEIEIPVKRDGPKKWAYRNRQTIQEDE